MKQKVTALSTADISELSALGLDEFEHGLLVLSRHFLSGYETYNTKAWNSAYIIAVERWGERIGLPVAFAVMKLIEALSKTRTDAVSYLDPLRIEYKSVVTDDEAALMTMLHHMRRDATAPARDAVEALCAGVLEPNVIRAGLSLAARFSCGAPRSQFAEPAPQLSVVA
jgi:hypothetical protein